VKYMIHSIAGTTGVALHRSRMFDFPGRFHRLSVITGRIRAGRLRVDQTTLRCAGELVSVRSSSTFTAASTPPARWGTPAADSPISTPDNAPIRVSALHSP